MNHETFTIGLDESTKLLISKVELMEEEISGKKKELTSKDQEIKQFINEIEI